MIEAMLCEKCHYIFYVDVSSKCTRCGSYNTTYMDEPTLVAYLAKRFQATIAETVLAHGRRCSDDLKEDMITAVREKWHKLSEDIEIPKLDLASLFEVEFV